MDGGKAEAFSRGCFKSGMRGPLPLSVKDELYAAALESKEAFFTSLDHLFKQTGVGLDSAANSQPLYDMDRLFEPAEVCRLNSSSYTTNALNDLTRAFSP